MINPIHERLRTETQAAHQRLEECVQIERKVASRPAYTELLRAFRGFYEPLEQRLLACTGWAEAGLDLEGRRKTTWLDADLAALGVSETEISHLPRCGRLPSVQSLARAFGAEYVLEGATLGGRHISAMLTKSGIPEDARHFFASYGSAVGARWQQFLAALGAFAESSGAGEEIVAGARETFSSLEAWLCAKGGERP
jgi:heme oxygenase